jgi:signal transduction histidine kinase
MRICQESLTNTLRHAHATSFLARLTFSPDEIHLELRDNGSGFDPHQKSQGFGLLGLKERVAEINGEVEIKSAPRQGTLIFVHLPL